MKVNIDNDNTLLTSGVWATYGDSKFLVTHMSNVNFQRAVMRGQAPHRRKIEKGTIDPEVSRKIMRTAMADALILDWKGVVDGEGKEVPFTKDVCERALARNEDLSDFISEFAMNLDNYRQAEKEELKKS